MKSLLTLKWCAAACLAAALVATATADQVVPRLDHVFVIMMENHAYGQIVGNPNAPFINHYADTANTADNYFAVAHPSLTNYLEIVGGSNFGVLSDNPPDWHNAGCRANIVKPFTQNRDDNGAGAVCPIAGTGMDAETVATDTTNETTPPYIPALVNIDGQSISSAQTIGKSIADQLAERGRSWKSYQESLPPGGANGVNNSDGFFTDSIADTQRVKAFLPLEDQTVPTLYAVKHNPFAYFRSVQEHGLGSIVGFEGPHGLFQDLASGRVPDFALIAPNQCHDQHGRGNAGAACDVDPGPLGNGTFTDGSMNFLNPALIYQGDLAVRTLVGAIHSSSVWQHGRTAIVVVWDENDYSAVDNRVLAIIDTNYGDHDVHSSRFYTHFSLLKTIQAGLGLPCLNHSCDANVPVMEDVFGFDR